MSAPKHKESHDDDREEPPFWERAVGALGVVLVLASLGFLLYDGIWGDDSPPDIVVEPGPIVDSGGDYLVRFVARNRGGGTAKDITITGTLTRGGRQIEESEATLDYVPSGATQPGGLYFREDPRNGELELNASGYQRP